MPNNARTDSRTSVSDFENAAAQRWNLERKHTKTEFEFVSFPFIEKLILLRKWQKTLHLCSFHLLSKSRSEIGSLYGTFVKLSKFRFWCKRCRIYRYITAPQFGITILVSRETPDHYTKASISLIFERQVLLLSLISELQQVLLLFLLRNLQVLLFYLIYKLQELLLTLLMSYRSCCASSLVSCKGLLPPLCCKLQVLLLSFICEL